MSKRIIVHHQEVNVKLECLAKDVLLPLQDLVDSTRHLVRVLSQQEQSDSADIKQSLVVDLENLLVEAQQLESDYYQIRAELQKIGQAGRHKDIDTEKEQERKLQRALTSTLTTWAREGSKFFDSVRLSLQTILDNFEALLGIKSSASVSSAVESAEQQASDSDAENKMEVFISLHNSRGGQENNLLTWESLLETIGQQVIHRPIYANESDVKTFIRGAKEPSNEGYVCVLIDDSQLIQRPGEQAKVDRHGRELLMIKEGSVKRQDVKRFVHLSGIYQYEKDKLVKIR
jgi:intracellular multiplication protein IcmQ